MGLSRTKKIWQEALSNMVIDPKDLFSLLDLDPALLASAYEAVTVFPLKVTHSFAARMKKGDPCDPLLKQVLPLGIEANIIPGYIKDPLHEMNANPVSGLLHKYRSRVLVTLTSACAIHCRYCFRRNFPYHENNPGRQGWNKIFSYIDKDHAINEVVLSGGDPLSVNDSLLKSFSDQLNAIKHIKILRIHTRLPIVLPERVTEDLLAWIKQLKQKIVIVVHVNHPQEINHEVQSGLMQLKKAGALLLNQSVLLKGVNDDAKVLAHLSEALIAADVLPYYLHVLDKVHGTAHFDIPIERALDLHAEMTNLLPGYLVPKLAREEPGIGAKVILS